MPAERSIREVLGYARIVRASPTVSVRDAARMMTAARCGSILVMAGERLLGIFTERDLLTRVVAVGRDPQSTTLNEVMTAEPDTIGIQASVKDAVRMMDEFGYRHLPVVERGRVVGVVSLRDMPTAELLAMDMELEAPRKVLVAGMR